jgi:hypothetical protein
MSFSNALMYIYHVCFNGLLAPGHTQNQADMRCFCIVLFNVRMACHINEIKKSNKSYGNGRYVIAFAKSEGHVRKHGPLLPA